MKAEDSPSRPVELCDTEFFVSNTTGPDIDLPSTLTNTIPVESQYYMVYRTPEPEPMFPEYDSDLATFCGTFARFPDRIGVYKASKNQRYQNDTLELLQSFKNSFNIRVVVVKV